MRAARDSTSRKWTTAMLLAVVMAATAPALRPDALANEPTAVPPQSAERNDVDTIMSRIGPPSQLTLSTYIDSGMTAPTDHHLTAAEVSRVRATLARLPLFYRRMLVLHLHRLSFVDGVAGVGSGLTARLGKTRSASDVTFRASLFGESLTQFFTHKEQRCFQPDGSDVSVDFEGGDMDAFTYVLLHEATHVVDFALGLSALRNAPNSHAPIFAGIWENGSTLAPPYAGSIISENVFREAEGGHPIKIGEAADVYRALAGTPFVDLFATASEAEDLSSAVAFDVLWRQDHISPKVIVRNKTGNVLYVYEPMKNPKVQARLPLVKQFLHTQPA